MTASVRPQLHVALCSNYPLDEARRLWASGAFPDFHLYGGAALERAGHRVTYLGTGRSEYARTRVGTWLRQQLGFRATQLAAVRSGAEVVVAAEPSVLATIGWLRSKGLWRRPLVVLMHPGLPPARGLLATALRGYDVVLTMSRRIHRSLLEDVGRPESSTHLVPYGPDLSWEGYRPGHGHLVVSTGKTHRDQATLVEALGLLDLPARVHTLEFHGEAATGTVTKVGSASYPAVLRDLCSAGVVAIPLARTDGTFGVTELNDALALGKPVVMTRNPYVDVDVETIGCGYLVDPADVAGWAQALDALRDPALRREMGARGRAFAESSWNTALFGDAVRRAVESVVTR